MGLGLLLVRFGLGSPRLIAGAMCWTYLAIRRRFPSMPEQEVLRELYESRVRRALARSRAARFGYSLEPMHVDQVVRHHATLDALIQHVVVQECPALLEHFGVLTSVLARVPGWRARICSTC